MDMTPYRTHDNGPLVEIRIEPGAVVVRMTADQWPCWTPMHDHTFDHDMLVVQGAVLLRHGDKARRVVAGEKITVEKHTRHQLDFSEPDTVAECRHCHADIHPDRALDGVPVEWIRRLTRAA